MHEKSRKEQKLKNTSNEYKLDDKSLLEIKNQMHQSFENLYLKFQQTTDDQSKFNIEFNEDICKLKRFINEEVNMIKKENESVLRELRRVERNYEERCENNNNKVNSFSPESDRVFKRILSPNNRSRITDLSHKHCLSEDGRRNINSNTITRERNAFSSVKDKREPRDYSQKINSSKRPETTKYSKLKRFKYFGKHRETEDQAIIRFKFRL